MRTAEQIRADIDEATRRRDAALAEIANMHNRLERADEADRAGLETRVREHNVAVERYDREIGTLEAELGRDARLRAAAANPARRVPADGGEPAPGEAPARSRVLDASPAGVARTAALRAIERDCRFLETAAGDRLVAVLERDQIGVDSAYIEAMANPHYARAFAMMLGRPGDARDLMTDDELGALRTAAQATHAREMAIGDPAAGGYGLPVQLDPSILLTSDGAISPLRQVARVVQMTSNEWKGVSSDGVTSTWSPEAQEAEDDSPTVAQPAVSAHRALTFIPYSFEVGSDYAGFGQELTRLITAARDELEAETFVNGNGVTEPQGFTVGIDGSSHVHTLDVNTLAVDDIYRLQEALPPRFSPRASWLSTIGIANSVHRFGGGGGSDEPPLFNLDRTRLLSKPWYETSNMDGVPAGHNVVLAYGDWSSCYLIGDRVGMSVEISPHLYGPAGRPTGQRGLVAWWRTAAGVLVSNAARLLVVSSS